MQRPARFRRYFYALQLALVSVLLYSAYLVNDFYRLTHEIAKIENSRFDMVALANELQQSSDQLTFFAQNYVVTQNPEYLDSFEQVLAIRDGRASRPQNYYATYWNLTAEERQTMHQGGKPTALADLMTHMPYSGVEFGLLNLAQSQSDQLAAIERRAFALIDTDPVQAKALLFGEEYKAAKHNIMAPIDQFLILLNTRLAKDLTALHQREEQLASSMPILLGLNTLLAAVILIIINIRFNRHQQELIKLSLTDHLTGIHNRKYLSEYAPQLLRYHRRHNIPVCLALVDIDHFKRINDDFGHQTGDDILRHFCDTIASRIRQTDVFVRYGGEEFVLLIPNMKADQCAALLDALCQRVATRPYHDKKHRIDYTASFGWADSSNHYDLDTMLHHADGAMYKAKQSGRNQVCRAHNNNNAPQLAIAN